MNELTAIITLIEERIAALYQAVKRQEDIVDRLEAELETGELSKIMRRRARFDSSRLILERLRGRLEEADKTYTLLDGIGEG